MLCKTDTLSRVVVDYACCFVVVVFVMFRVYWYLLCVSSLLLRVYVITLYVHLS